MLGFLNHATTLPPIVPGAIDHLGGFLPSEGTRPFYYFRTRQCGLNCGDLGRIDRVLVVGEKRLGPQPRPQRSTLNRLQWCFLSPVVRSVWHDTLSFLGALRIRWPETHRRAQRLRTEARNARNVRKSAIPGISAPEPSPIYGVLLGCRVWHCQTPFPRPGVDLQDVHASTLEDAIDR